MWGIFFRSRYRQADPARRADVIVFDQYSVRKVEAMVMPPADHDGAPAYGPLAQSGGIWEKGLETLVEAENRIIDCLYR